MAATDGSATERSSQTLQDTPAAREGRRISLYDYVAAFFILDIATLIGAGLAVSKMASFGRGGETAIAGETFIGVMCLGVFFHLVAAKNLDVYNPKTVVRLDIALRRVLLSLACAFALLMAIAVAIKATESYSRLWFFSWAGASFALVAVARVILVKRLRGQLARGAYVQRASSVGIFCDPVRPAVIARETGNVVHVVSSARLDDIEGLAALSDQIAQLEIDQVFIAAPWERIPAVLDKVDSLRHLSTQMFLLPAERKVCREIAQVGKFGERLSFCAIEHSIFGWSLWFKRVEDVTIGVALLILLAPLMSFVALAIRLDSPGPVFFRQERTGFNGRRFHLWKFRSMYVEMTDATAKRQTSQGDARVTRIGRFIRRASLDELPQLFNVIEGTMSIVGPRPHALATQTNGRNLDELVDYYAVRHRVKPGITGWAQVHGFRGELDSIEKLRARVNYDLDYIDNWNIWLDLEIIFRTSVLFLLGDEHAY